MTEALEALIAPHRWLFASYGLRMPDRGAEDTDEWDAARVEAARADALRRIRDAGGLPALLYLLDTCEASNVAHAPLRLVLTDDDAVELALLALADADARAARGAPEYLLAIRTCSEVFNHRGFAAGCRIAARARDVSANARACIFLGVVGERELLPLLAREPEDVQATYWRERAPVPLSDGARADVLAGLIRHGRGGQVLPLAYQVERELPSALLLQAAEQAHENRHRVPAAHAQRARAALLAVLDAVIARGDACMEAATALRGAVA